MNKKPISTSVATPGETAHRPARGTRHAERNLLDKLLLLFSDVRPKEGLGVLLLTLNLIILLSTYYLLKTVRETLVLVEGGAEVKAYSAAAQAILLIAIVPLYGWVTTRLNRIQLLRWSNLFFAINLVAFFFLGRAGFRVGIAYYIWVGIFNVFSIAQLWGFATDLMTEEQGKRLFPILGIGASVGAVAGAWLAGRLISPIGPYNIMLVGVGGLLMCALLARIAGHLIARRSGVHEQVKNQETLGKTGGFQLLLADRYLMLIAALTILLNIVSVSGDFILGKLILAHANESLGQAASAVKAKKLFVGAFYSSYYEWTNICSFLVQSLLVSRMLKYVGVRRSLFVLPLLSAATFGAIIAFPVLAVVRTLKIAENATNYSLQNTVRNALFLPTSREAKYKAKAAIETFCVRLGDVIQAAIVYAGTALHFTIKSFALLSFCLTFLWLIVALLLFLEHRKRSSAHA